MGQEANGTGERMAINIDLKARMACNMYLNIQRSKKLTTTYNFE